MRIRTKVLLTLFAMSMLVALVGVLAVNRQRAAAISAATKEAEHVASVVGLLMSDQIKLPASLQETAVRLHRTQGRDVVLVDTYKRILADADPEDAGQKYEWDKGNEVGLTMKDRHVRTFIEIGEDHPTGIKQIVVPVEGESGEVIGAVILEYTPLYREMMHLAATTTSQVVLIGSASAGIALLLALYMGRSVGAPLKQLTNAAIGFAAGRTDLVMPSQRADEIGQLVIAFSSMMEKRQQAEEALRQARDQLEVRVITRTADLAKANEALQAENTARQLSQTELQKVHKELLEVSRQAGMAEVATSVLHNVGNVLNSVNVASSCVAESLKKSKSTNLTKVAALMREHEADLGAFLTTDPKGKQLPGYLTQLADYMVDEQAVVLKELAGLQMNVEHIKDIVTMQQSFARASGVIETTEVKNLVDDALRLNSGALIRHDVRVIREYEEVPPITIDRHKVLQVLVNVIRNAKYACDESKRPDKQITMRVADGDDRIRISISDNGIGIPQENLLRIFNHGFTTRKDGHGFGLHSGALAAKEIGGSLTVQSDGVGQGAVFTLELPCDAPEREERVA